ncbi:MAG TPA: hypothetical protein VFK36_03015 [Gemmatimonadales bacterium]|nr:hypothetical protein [Gemmatimonadales bacterium]
MPKFRVRLASRSSLRAEARRTFRGQDYSVRVGDATSTAFDGASIHDGLLYTVEVDAHDIHAAMQLARGLTSRLADLLSFTHSCAIEEPELLFALSLEAREGAIQFAQAIRNAPELRRFRRVFAPAETLAVHDAIELLRQAGAAGDELRRIERAIRCLRRSRIETDQRDRFEELCAGLQAMEPLLRARFPVQRRLGRGRGDWSGVHQFATTVSGLDSAAVEALASRRADIVHALADDHEVLVDLTRLGNIAEKLVQFGVLVLLGLEADDLHAVTRPVLKMATRPELTVVVDLTGASLDDIEQATRYPVVKLHHVASIRPNEPIVDTAPDSLMALTIHVEVENYNGSWEPAEARWVMYRDPVDESPFPALSLEKWPR